MRSRSRSSPPFGEASADAANPAAQRVSRVPYWSTPRPRRIVLGSALLMTLTRKLLGVVVAGRRRRANHVMTFYMAWSKDSGDRGPRGYHHGNLKEALIRAALELIAQKGPAGFTFAEAARWAGVSPAAPYRHFRDRDELLVDVARRGFDQFAQALSAAWGEGRPDPFTAFERLGR